MIWLRLFSAERLQIFNMVCFAKQHRFFCVGFVIMILSPPCSNECNYLPGCSSLWLF